MTAVKPYPVYKITVAGELHPSWHEWLDFMDISIDAAGMTILEGPVPDQSALRGLLNRIWDLNLTVIAVIRLSA